MHTAHSCTLLCQPYLCCYSVAAFLRVRLVHTRTVFFVIYFMISGCCLIALVAVVDDSVFQWLNLSSLSRSYIYIDCKPELLLYQWSLLYFLLWEQLDLICWTDGGEEDQFCYTAQWHFVLYLIQLFTKMSDVRLRCDVWHKVKQRPF